MNPILRSHLHDLTAAHTRLNLIILDHAHTNETCDQELVRTLTSIRVSTEHALDVFRQKPASKPSVYIHLFHGRTEKDGEPDDTGRSGPVFGPYAFIDTIVGAELQLMKDPDTTEQDLLRIVGDAVYYDGVYYGDWTAFPELNGRMREEFNPSKAELRLEDRIKTYEVTGSYGTLIVDSEGMVLRYRQAPDSPPYYEHIKRLNTAEYARYYGQMEDTDIELIGYWHRPTGAHEDVYAAPLAENRIFREQEARPGLNADFSKPSPQQGRKIQEPGPAPTAPTPEMIRNGKIEQVCHRMAKARVADAETSTSYVDEFMTLVRHGLQSPVGAWPESSLDDYLQHHDENGQLIEEGPGAEDGPRAEGRSERSAQSGEISDNRIPEQIAEENTQLAAKIITGVGGKLPPELEATEPSVLDAVDPDMIKVPGWPFRTRTGLAEDLEAIVFEVTTQTGYPTQISRLAPKLAAYLADKSVEKRREALQQLGQWSPRLANEVAAAGKRMLVPMRTRRGSLRRNNMLWMTPVEKLLLEAQQKWENMPAHPEQTAISSALGDIRERIADFVESHTSALIPRDSEMA